MSDMKIVNFMALRKVAGALSMALVLGALISLAVNQLQFGLDFTGGTLIEVGYEQAPSLNLCTNWFGFCGGVYAGLLWCLWHYS